MKKAASKESGFVPWIWGWVKSIALALVVWFFLRTFLVEAFRIPSGSMENTLMIGDFLFVNKALYGAEVPLIHKRLPAVREPRRGDLIVFDSVEEDIKVVKRLIGLPGDTLSMEGGQLRRNGQKTEEPYAVHADPLPSADPFQRQRMREWQLPYAVTNRILFCHGGQSGQLARQPNVGLPAPRECSGPPAAHLFQLRSEELAAAAVHHRRALESDLLDPGIVHPRAVAPARRSASSATPAATKKGLSSTESWLTNPNSIGPATRAIAPEL
jgi:signal peptidase I